MKKLLAMMLATVLMVTAFQVPASAAVIDDGAVEPMWENTGVVNCFVSLTDDGYGSAEALVRGYPNVTFISCEVYVYLQVGSDWEYIGDYRFESFSNRLLGAYEFETVEGGYYKADFTITVTAGTVDEVIMLTEYSE